MSNIIRTRTLLQCTFAQYPNVYIQSAVLVLSRITGVLMISALGDVLCLCVLYNPHFLLFVSVTIMQLEGLLLFLKTNLSTTELKDKVLSTKLTYLRMLALVDILFVLYNHIGACWWLSCSWRHSGNFHDRDAANRLILKIQAFLLFMTSMEFKTNSCMTELQN